LVKKHLTKLHLATNWVTIHLHALGHGILQPLEHEKMSINVQLGDISPLTVLMQSCS